MHETRKLIAGGVGSQANAELYGAASRLRLSKASLATRAFQKSVLEQVEEIVYGALHAVGNSIALPDVIVPILAGKAGGGGGDGVCV